MKEHFESRLGEDGRILIRASGTEPVVRVMAEGMDAVMIEQMVEEMACQIAKYLG
jgi:phosphoglucosamine mutase